MSLISTYQSRKTLLAQKLTDKGVTASGSEGLTTLINKIDDIPDGLKDGIIIWSDKKIIQSSENIEFYSLALTDGVYSPPATSPIMTSKERTFSNNSLGTVIDEPIGNHWVIDTQLHFYICASGVTPNNGEVLWILPNQGVYRYHDRSLLTLSTVQDTHFECKDGILYFGDTSLDLTSYGIDLTNLNKVFNDGTIKFLGETSSVNNANVVYYFKKGGVNMSEYIYLGYGVTDANGVATLDHSPSGSSLSHSYTGVGAGETGVVASLANPINSSSSQSVPYTVWDTIYHNEEISSTISLDVSTNSNSIGLEFDAYMGANNSQTWFSLGTDNNNRILVGVIYGSSQQGIIVRSNGSTVNSVYASTRAPVGETSHIKFTYDNGVMTYSDGDETITLTDSTISPSKLLSGTIVQDGSVSNLKLYKI